MAEFNHHVHLPSSQQVEKERSLLHHHKESHFTAGEIVSNIIIRVSDGLTVPFALVAGLSGANASSSIILSAGIAEVATGAISMGLGGVRETRVLYPLVSTRRHGCLCYCHTTSESDF